MKIVEKFEGKLGLLFLIIIRTPTLIKKGHAIDLILSYTCATKQCENVVINSVEKLHSHIRNKYMKIKKKKNTKIYKTL